MITHVFLGGAGFLARKHMQIRRKSYYAVTKPRLAWRRLVNARHTASFLFQSTWCFAAAEVDIIPRAQTARCLRGLLGHLHTTVSPRLLACFAPPTNCTRTEFWHVKTIAPQTTSPAALPFTATSFLRVWRLISWTCGLIPNAYGAQKSESVAPENPVKSYSS